MCKAERLLSQLRHRTERSTGENDLGSAGHSFVHCVKTKDRSIAKVLWQSVVDAKYFREHRRGGRSTSCPVLTSKVERAGEGVRA